MIEFKTSGVHYTIDPVNNKEIGTFSNYIQEFASGNWEQNTFEVFEKSRNSEKAAVDIGAWIGTTAIWLSNNFKKVIAVEADTKAVDALRHNLRTSNCKNVHVIDRPIYRENVPMSFGPNQYVELFKQEGLGCSTSHLQNAEGVGGSYSVETVTLYDLEKIIPFDEIEFVKVDIEGGEEFILEDLVKIAETYKWKLWVSFHYSWWADKDISRFKHLLDSAKHISLDRAGNPITGNFTQSILHSPFSSLYIEF